ncbi:MAG: large conductance mechanosensitive channel protein MscL [Lachnospiraceae bacterium]|nr:large conductance mechanosensitive channel protein MscL [Lachnospiraceae bacterium]
MRQFLKGFKEFALRGNVVDLAVGVIIGGAFQAIVSSLTSDVISPFIGLFASTDFSNLVLTINGVDIRYGSFITAVINFIIMAFIIFMFMKILNKLTGFDKKDEKVVEPTTKECPYCFSEIHMKATRCPHCTGEIEE